MGLADITRAGVERAVAEFDRLGRDKFLETYGFGRSKAYFLKIGAVLYDSKAIAGAAHGFSGTGLRPLEAAAFSGGENTVRRQLESLGFQVVKLSGRNPDWTRDEIILALDVYFRHRPKFPAKTSGEIATLSRDIQRLATSLGLSGDETFRNANGVYMKLMNFRRLDPEQTSAGRVGLPGGSQIEEEVWSDFANDQQRLASAAAVIRAALESGEASNLTDEMLAGDDEDFPDAPEGRLVTRLHRVRERDRKIVARKKASVLKQTGRLACEACGFDFAKRYGPRGENFAECHHTKPLGELTEPTMTTIADLAIVCANCHRMIHAKQPWLAIDEVRSLLR